ncbi:MAG: hypothetical protein LBD86_00290 [Spirochaetaceae bacterium]|nr:hypothetical protein [Spirochaetaceae bacterium]
MYPGDFSSARDFFYLSAILAGTALGFFFSFYKKGLRRGQKENRVTAGFWLLPAAVLSAVVAFILAGGELLRESGLLTVAGCLAAAGILSVLLPEAFLFPVIVTSGICVVFAAYIFLRYPGIYAGVPVTRVALDAADTILIEPEYPKFTSSNKFFSDGSPRPRYKNYYSKAHPFTLEYTAVIVTVNRMTPLIGGQQRCILTGLNLVDDRHLRLKLYFPAFLEDIVIGSLLLYDGPFVEVRSFLRQIDLNNLDLYSGYTVYFDGSRLYTAAKNRFDRPF